MKFDVSVSQNINYIINPNQAVTKDDVNAHAIYSYLFTYMVPVADPLTKMPPTVDIPTITSDPYVLSHLPGVSPGQTTWPCTWRGTSEQVMASADLLSLYRDQPPGCPALVGGRSVCPAKACHFAPYPVPPGISGRKAYWAVVGKKNAQKKKQQKTK